ncbi:hypothetical protein PAXINDRAFT_170647 [Paxillus involutus ATCC 200175]|uniref:Uncharacterized protein n=1 Tax=Paxillus involutus ATCC 200175 TaxID=664439 RepID=A0A0C9SVA0_PAXIN|nr:hypothetical protein PAXINDRAFT_170647 [Paxillus involutus ATCC 200175]
MLRGGPRSSGLGVGGIESGTAFSPFELGAVIPLALSFPSPFPPFPLTSSSFPFDLEAFDGPFDVPTGIVVPAPFAFGFEVPVASSLAVWRVKLGFWGSTWAWWTSSSSPSSLSGSLPPRLLDFTSPRLPWSSSRVRRVPLRGTWPFRLRW